MDKEQKKQLKSRYKKNEQDTIRNSMPMKIEELKALLSYVDQSKSCDHTLKTTLNFIKSHNLDADKIVPWLNDQGGYCDCEVVGNVYDAVGNIVGWHLDKGH